MNKVEASIHQLIISVIASVFATVCTSRSWRFTPAEKVDKNTLRADKLALGNTTEISDLITAVERESNNNENVKTSKWCFVCIRVHFKSKLLLTRKWLHMPETQTCDSVGFVIAWIIVQDFSPNRTVKFFHKPRNVWKWNRTVLLVRVEFLPQDNKMAIECDYVKTQMIQCHSIQKEKRREYIWRYSF